MANEPSRQPPSRRVISAYVAFAARYRVPLLVLALVFSLACAWLARGVRVDSRLQALLPAETPSAAAGAELKERLRSPSPLYLLVHSSDTATSRRLAQKLSVEVQKWPETRWVMSRRDPSYFLEHRLLFLERDDLQELNDSIAERYRFEECARLPACENLEDEAPPLPSEADLQKLFDKNPDIRALASLFGNDTAEFSQSRPKSAQQPAASDTESSRELGELCDAATHTCTVQVALDRDPDDLVFAQEILDRSEGLFGQLREGVTDPELQMAVSGPFRNAAMTQRAVSKDLQKTTLVGVVLVLGVVLLQFAGLWSVLLLMVPAALGIVWTLAPLGLAGVQLNVISVFTLAVLAGVGIDFGVHLITHFSHRRKQVPVEAALVDTYTELLPSLIAAAATTATGFCALAAASFRGFSQMGPLAALGVVISLIAYLVLLPPLILLLDRGERGVLRVRTWGVNPWDWLRGRRALLTSAGVLLAVIGTAIGVGYGHTGVAFEYDFGKLRPQGVKHGISWSKTMHGTARTAVYVLSDDRAALDEFARDVRQSPPADIVHTDRPFLTLPSAFIPLDQPARLVAIAELAKTLAHAREKATGELRERIDTFLPLAQVKTEIALSGMPNWVQDWLVERDGRFGTLGVLYSRLSGSDARQMETLAEQLQAWRDRYPKVRFASPVAQLGEVTPRLRAEAPKILGLALFGVLVGTLMVGRSWRRALIVLAPLALSGGLAVGAMALFDVRVNLYNMLVFPLAFGIGIDGAIYVLWALTAGGDGARLSTAARAVLGSTLTSMAGFGALMVSNNPGLFSIGELCVLTLGLSLVVNLLWLPAAFWALSSRRPPAEPQSP